MKNILILSLLVLLAFLSCTFTGTSFTESNYKGSDKQYSFIQSYKVTSPTELKISTSGGNIDTEGYSSDSVSVAFIVSKNNKILDITLNELQKLADIEISHESNKLQILVRKT